MRVSYSLALLPALLVVTIFIRHSDAAAVMSIDLGTEWMKVSLLYYPAVLIVLKLTSFFSGWHRVTWLAYGDRTQQRVEEKNSFSDRFQRQVKILW